MRDLPRHPGFVASRDDPWAFGDRLAWEGANRRAAATLDLIERLRDRLGPTGIFAARDRLLGSLVHHVRRAAPVVEAVLAR